MLPSKIYNLFAISIIFILAGCSKGAISNTLIPDGNKNTTKSLATLITYKPVNKGSRLMFAGGNIKIIDHCVYLDTGKEKISLIFPSTFKLLNNFITDGKVELKLGQDLRLNGHIVDINSKTISSLNISKNHCLNGVKRAWLYYQ